VKALSIRQDGGALLQEASVQLPLVPVQVMVCLASPVSAPTLLALNTVPGPTTSSLLMVGRRLVPRRLLRRKLPPYFPKPQPCSGNDNIH